MILGPPSTSQYEKTAERLKGHAWSAPCSGFLCPGIRGLASPKLPGHVYPEQRKLKEGSEPERKELEQRDTWARNALDGKGDRSKRALRSRPSPTPCSAADLTHVAMRWSQAAQ